MNKKKAVFFSALIMVIFACGHCRGSRAESDNFNQYSVLQVGNLVDYFDVVDLDGNIFGKQFLLEKPFSLIIIFPRPCAPCSPAFGIWKQAALLTGNQFQKCGIVLDDPVQAMKLIDKRAGWIVCLPYDRVKFTQGFRLEGDKALTLVLRGLKVEFVHEGEITSAVYTRMMRSIKIMEKSI